MPHNANNAGVTRRNTSHSCHHWRVRASSQRPSAGERSWVIDTPVGGRPLGR
ncbi:hypothetical protein HMPREF0591_1653 [Mycobacterium parascrofulaceum ATCC BAA-614]|uniref:Uncharacterized protein n=1 Tax=Mycobacterium parascrofulaceum ATCC BAA-614 TaxID=525368 RepID=D5P659_9MYCO|nr:hypothetical protein HMPREF0591_1653 [Mycobacterium parascrofulaceum ATCC BAA-614]